MTTGTVSGTTEVVAMHSVFAAYVKVQCVAAVKHRTGGETWEDTVVTSLQPHELA